MQLSTASLNVGNRQATKVFAKLFQIDHSHAQMAHFSSRVSSCLDLKWQGTAQDLSKKGAKLIVYGIAGSHDDVPSDVFDAPFAFEGGAMVMETDLNLNGNAGC